MNFKKINIITGHYGSGKTNVSVNMALDLAAKGEKVTVVDLDIVNPYFRTADFKVRKARYQPYRSDLCKFKSRHTRSRF